MKKTFTKDYIIKHKGCYDLEKVESLSFINNKRITITTILNSEMSLSDKTWFLFRKCDMTTRDIQELALKLAWSVEPIYAKKYPNDNRVKECLQATRDYLDGKITKDELCNKRRAADSAAADAAAAAYAAAAAAYSAADAAAAAYSAAYAAAAAAYSAAAAAYSAGSAWEVAAAYSAADSAATYADVIKVIKDFIKEL